MAVIINMQDNNEGDMIDENRMLCQNECITLYADTHICDLPDLKFTYMVQKGGLIHCRFVF